MQESATEVYLKSNIKYYSFKILKGRYGHKDHMLLDWKLPAIDIRTAISSFYITWNLINNTKCKTFYRDAKSYHLPTKLYVKDTFFRVIEYERKYTPKRGYTIHVYRKTREYTQDDIPRLFRDSY